MASSEPPEPWRQHGAWKYPANSARVRNQYLRDYQRRDTPDKRRDPLYKLYRAYNRHWREWAQHQRRLGVRNSWDELPERSTQRNRPRRPRLPTVTKPVKPPAPRTNDRPFTHHAPLVPRPTSGPGRTWTSHLPADSHNIKCK